MASKTTGRTSTGRRCSECNDTLNQNEKRVSDGVDVAHAHHNLGSNWRLVSGG